MVKKTLGLVLLVLLTGGAGCSSSSSKSNETSDGLRIVATTSMVGDLVRRVAGDRAQVTTLIGEGIDPHLYRATSTDVGKMMKADLVFYSGLGLEGAMESAFKNAVRRGKMVVPVTDAIPKSRLRFPDGVTGHPDPHVWNEPGLWLHCLDLVVTSLSEKDPQYATAYQERAAVYRQELKQLDRYARELIETIPEGNRSLVTAHDAFSYFANAYGLEERSVQGISTESEPGIQDINNLVNELVKKQIPALFVEATVNADSLRAVMERCQNKGWTVRQGGTLYSDSMGPAGSYEGTYPGMIDHNVTTIVRALNGTVLDGGFQQYKNRIPSETPPSN
ncbi:MAG TPA: zinc ABC transporter substrate-binding protein [Planctomicrobium sp.]|nr:zinc ABC transporter substrate-binding protein [Planctomicrobium sp.]